MNSEISNRNRAQEVISNLVNVASIAVKFSPHKGAGIENLQESLRFYSGSENPLFNGVFGDKDVADNPHQHFSEITQFFSSKNVPFIWWGISQSSLPQNIKSELDNFGFQSLGDCLGIVKELDDITPVSLPKNVKIKEVLTEEEYQDYVNITTEQFQILGSAKSDFGLMYKSYGPAGFFKHYLAYYEDKPVATVTSYINDNVVGLYCGATLPSAQKKGICTVLLMYAMLEAKKLGCQTAIAQLIAPGMAKGITEKLGFTTCCVLLPFIKNV